MATLAIPIAVAYFRHLLQGRGEEVMLVKSLVVLSVVASVTGCGGGNGNTPGTGTAYDFVPPVVNSARTYSETIVDNANNTIIIGYTQTVTAIAADGTITEMQQSTTGSSAIVNGTNYAPLTETETYDGTSGQETSYTYTAASGEPTTCTYDPRDGGPDFPLRVGQTWSISYTFACGSESPVTYEQSGSVVDVESVTVPAGTFNALKLQSTVTWTNLEGTSRTETVTNWRDIATSHSVKEAITIAVGGTLPTTGYPVSREIVLESIS
jgi:hypothetical protein